MLLLLPFPHFCGPHLVVKACDLLLARSGQQERVHLGLQGVVHLYVNVVAGCLLLIIRVHTTHIHKQTELGLAVSDALMLGVETGYWVLPMVTL